jgi:hypothetical protein
MTATLEEAVADLQRANTELQRKLGEHDDALAQQAAGAEVLQVINSLPGDLAPVFKSMLEKAVGLCDLDFSDLFTYDGQHFHGVSAHRLPERGFSARAHSNKLTASSYLPRSGGFAFAARPPAGTGTRTVPPSGPHFRYIRRARW